MFTFLSVLLHLLDLKILYASAKKKAICVSIFISLLIIWRKILKHLPEANYGRHLQQETEEGHNQMALDIYIFF